MGRMLPLECEHGTTIDWGDFGPCQGFCDENHPGEPCPDSPGCRECEARQPQQWEPTDSEKLGEIFRLLQEAYDHYFKFGDGHCKMSEGNVTLSWDYGNYWERIDGHEPEQIVEIYSYVLGPSRSHTFNSLDEALETVREWHEREMTFDYEKAAAEEAAYWASQR